MNIAKTFVFRETEKKTENMPELKDWCLYFEKKYGPENRLKSVKSFARFFNTTSKQICFGNKFMLGGRIRGYKAYEGSYVITTEIIRMERITREDSTSKVFCATAKNGREYYFNADECDNYMRMMLEDIKKTGQLKETPGYYLKYAYMGNTFL